jgi:hypothetical protein
LPQPGLVVHRRGLDAACRLTHLVHGCRRCDARRRTRRRRRGNRQHECPLAQAVAFELGILERSLQLVGPEREGDRVAARVVQQPLEVGGLPGDADRARLARRRGDLEHQVGRLLHRESRLDLVAGNGRGDALPVQRVDIDEPGSGAGHLHAHSFRWRLCEAHRSQDDREPQDLPVAPLTRVARPGDDCNFGHERRAKRPSGADP